LQSKYVGFANQWAKDVEELDTFAKRAGANWEDIEEDKDQEKLRTPEAMSPETLLNFQFFIVIVNFVTIGRLSQTGRISRAIPTVAKVHAGYCQAAIPVKLQLKIKVIINPLSVVARYKTGFYIRGTAIIAAEEFELVDVKASTAYGITNGVSKGFRATVCWKDSTITFGFQPCFQRIG
jgi:hypothetical protein